MRKFYVILMLTLLIFGCASDDDGIIPSQEEFTFTQNSSIFLEVFGDNSIAQITDGDLLVFKYLFIGEDDPETADEEYSEAIIFEVDPSADSFSYTNAELSANNTYFTRYCFCANINSILITEGTIQGTKTSNGNWQIAIDITFSYYDSTETRVASGTYELDQ